MAVQCRQGTIRPGEQFGLRQRYRRTLSRCLAPGSEVSLLDPVTGLWVFSGREGLRFVCCNVVRMQSLQSRQRFLLLFFFLSFFRFTSVVVCFALCFPTAGTAALLCRRERGSRRGDERVQHDFGDRFSSPPRPGHGLDGGGSMLRPTEIVPAKHDTNHIHTQTHTQAHKYRIEHARNLKDKQCHRKGIFHPLFRSPVPVRSGRDAYQAMEKLIKIKMLARKAGGSFSFPGKDKLLRPRLIVLQTSQYFIPAWMGYVRRRHLHSHCGGGLGHERVVQRITGRQ